VTAYAVLLRAVNVGGRNRLAMPELCAALAAAGLKDVSSLLQSGNVLCRSSEPEGAVAALARGAIADALGLDVGVVVRSAAEMADVAAASPFLAPGEERDPKTLHVAFLASAPLVDPDTIDQARFAPDTFTVLGREAYLSYPGGSGRSKLTLAVLERALGVEGTARNWSTVQRLAGLLAGP
jgi:uncharacterized protein (DUF1697 family)